MKVLIFNEYTSIRGGVDNIADIHIDNLPVNGIEVLPVRYFNKDYISLATCFKANKLSIILSGNKVVKNLQSAIDEYQPEIIHFHNVYQLFRKPIWSLINPGKGKIVIHLHNFYSYCLNSFLFRNGQNCEDCLMNNSWKPGIRNKCYDNSLLKSYFVSSNRISPKEWVTKANKTSLLFAVSNFVKAYYVKSGIIDNKISVLTNPCTINTQVQESSIGNYILFLGNVRKEKGIEIFCRCAENLPEIRFVVAGDGMDKEYYQTKFSHLRNLKFIGYVEGEHKSHVIQNARFLFQPSLLKETYGLSLLEAYSHGKPVVSTGYGGNSELILHSKTGFIIDSNKYSDFLSILRYLWEKIPEDNLYNSECKNFVKQFSINNHIKSLIEMYKTVLY